MNKDRLAEKISALLLKMQDRFSRSMTSICSRLPVKMQWVALVLFSASVIAFSAWVMADSLRRKKSGTIPVMHIRTIDIGKQPRPSTTIITSITYAKMKRLEKFLDSLCNSGSDSGRSLYDSIVRTRRGMLDSMQELEKIYLSK